MNNYTCELCGERMRDYNSVATPFYFTVLGGPDDDAWGKHSNEAKFCDRHVDEYEWPWASSDLSPVYQRRDNSPRGQCERAVIAIVEKRRIPDDVEPDYFFAPQAVEARREREQARKELQQQYPDGVTESPDA